MDVEALKRDACAAIDAMAGDLVAVSHYIHANPELAFKEEKAAARLTAEVERAGLAVERGAYGVGTAFASAFGKPGAPEVGILSEYDALPGIGHSCGHNVIATIGLGAALGLAKLGARLPGRVRYLGTPAEEAGGGKEFMAQNGAFDGLDAAMMVHSAGFDIETMPCICVACISESPVDPWRVLEAAAAPVRPRLDPRRPVAAGPRPFPRPCGREPAGHAPRSA